MQNHEILELVKKKHKIIDAVRKRCKEDSDIEGQMFLSFKHEVAAIINEMTEQEINIVFALNKTILTALVE